MDRDLQVKILTDAMKITLKCIHCGYPLPGVIVYLLYQQPQR